MNQFAVPIGAQCTTPTIFEKRGLKKETLPFDWMFSTPTSLALCPPMLLIWKTTTWKIKNCWGQLLPDLMDKCRVVFQK